MSNISISNEQMAKITKASDSVFDELQVEKVDKFTGMNACLLAAVLTAYTDDKAFPASLREMDREKLLHTLLDEMIKETKAELRRHS